MSKKDKAASPRARGSKSMGGAAKVSQADLDSIIEGHGGEKVAGRRNTYSFKSKESGKK